MVQKIEHFRDDSPEELDDLDEEKLIKKNRAKLKLVENPPTFTEALAAHGIHDYGSLMSISVRQFPELEFPPYGKGRAFAGAILGRTIYHITNEILQEIAEKLELPLVASERLNQFREALSVNGITDRLSLLALGPKAFYKSDRHFPPFGRGRMFYSALFGSSVPHIKITHLHLIADTLGFPEVETVDYRQVLYRNGILDQASLLRVGLDNFFKGELPPFKSGMAFVCSVLGRTLRKFRMSDFQELSEQLDLPQLTLMRQQEFRDLLSANGIEDRSGLVAMDIHDFSRLPFPPYGKGQAFAGVVLGRTVRIRKPVLRELADKLDLPHVAGKRLHQFKRALLVYGVKDRATLVAMKPSAFEKKTISFPPFGKGFAFYKALMGSSISEFTVRRLHEMADALGYPDITVEDYRVALEHQGITDKLGLQRMNKQKFAGTNFKPFGYGAAFVGCVLGISAPRISSSILDEFAAKLSLPQISVASLHDFKNVLFKNGIYDRKTLRSILLDEIKKLDFGAYGTIYGFLSIVLDETGLPVSHELLDRVAVRLRLPEDSGYRTPKIRYTDVYFYGSDGIGPGHEKYDEVVRYIERYEIYEKRDLLAKGPEWIMAKNFEGFGNGLDLVSSVLGRRLARVTVTDLEEMADRLEFVDL